MPSKVRCSRKTVKQCKRAAKSCEYARTAKSQHCRKCRDLKGRTLKGRTLRRTMRK